MHFTKQGLHLNKAELSAILAFTSKEESKPQLMGAKIVVADGRVCAYATDGRASVVGEGLSDSHNRSAEYFVNSDFLKAAHKVATKGNDLLLEFKDDGLHDACVLDDEGEEVGRWHQDEEGASTQTSAFPDVRIKIPNGEHPCANSTLDASHLRSLTAICKAADIGALDVHMPKTRDDGVVFRVGVGGDTTWTARIMPAASDAAEAKDDKAPDPNLDEKGNLRLATQDPPRRGGGKRRGSSTSKPRSGRKARRSR